MYSSYISQFYAKDSTIWEISMQIQETMGLFIIWTTTPLTYLSRNIRQYKLLETQIQTKEPILLSNMYFKKKIIHQNIWMDQKYAIYYVGN